MGGWVGWGKVRYGLPGLDQCGGGKVSWVVSFWFMNWWGHVVELADVGSDICTCFREPISLDCYQEYECVLLFGRAIGVKVRSCRFIDHMDFLEICRWVFPGPGFKDCYLHSLYLSCIIFQIDRVSTSTTLLLLFNSCLWDRYDMSTLEPGCICGDNGVSRNQSKWVPRSKMYTYLSITKHININ